MDGPGLHVRGPTQLPDFDWQPVEAEHFIYWTFQKGQYTGRREITSRHHGTRLPDNQSMLWRAEGNYWLKSREGAACTYHFERTDGQVFDYTEGQPVDLGREFSEATLFLGRERIELFGLLYKFTGVENLEQVRSGVL